MPERYTPGQSSLMWRPLKRTVIIVGAVVSVLLITTIVLVSILITTTTHEAENARITVSALRRTE